MKKVMVLMLAVFICLGFALPSWSAQREISPKKAPERMSPTVQVCPQGWKLMPGSDVNGKYDCERVVTTRTCAPGFQVQEQACSGTYECAYQCIPVKPNFIPKCKGDNKPHVGPCNLGCSLIIY